MKTMPAASCRETERREKMKHLKKIICAAIALALLLSLCPVASAYYNVPMSGEEWEVLLRTNRERVRAGLEPLTATDKLQQAGGIRAEEIAGKFDHVRPDGSSCFSIAEEVGLGPYVGMAENIAGGYRDPEEVVAAWMESPGHRGNIMEPRFRHVGIGFARNENSYYIRQWTQFFFTGPDCAYEGMTFAHASVPVVPVGTTIEEMGLTACLECSNKSCGMCYLPVMSEFCTGFEPGVEGTFRVRVDCLGCTGWFTVLVTDEENPVLPGERYRDVHCQDWFYQSVEFAHERNLMGGVGNDCFDPEGSMTRAMLVTVLWRLEGKPEAGASPFTDVPDGEWYTDAVSWASETGVAGGIGGGKFDPEGNVTREQMATILCRYAKNKGVDVSERADLTSFPDCGQVSSWAQEALQWCVAREIIGGSEGKLLPGGSATRAQIAAVLMRYIKNVIG